MAPGINLAPRHIVAPGNACERLAARLHRRQNLQLLRFTPSPPPFPAQNLHRPSLALEQDVHNDVLMDVTYPLTSILGRRPQSVGYQLIEAGVIYDRVNIVALRKLELDSQR